MRTYRLHLFTALAAISVLLFAGVAYAQSEDATLEEDLVELCQEAEGTMRDGTCFVHPSNWCGFENSPALCLDRRFDGRWMADPELLEDTLVEGVEAEPETIQPDLPATQPARAQQGTPQYTG